MRKQKKDRPTVPWKDWFHCMGHTYGTWLPGDPRGFRTRHHRQHVEGDYKNPPPKGKYDALHRASKRLMKRDPVSLTIEQRVLIVRLLAESLARRGLEIAVACVTDVHFHFLVRLPDHHARHWLGVAKKESSHYAKEAGQGVVGGLWGVRTKSLPISDRAHGMNVARYIHDHQVRGGAIWYPHKLLLPARRSRKGR